MVSNVTLLSIHRRLVEVFNTEGDKNGWFSKRNLFFLGDLFQLRPVFEHPIYTSVSDVVARKRIGCLSGGNIWQKLFTYDELTINMRQRDEQGFVSLLSRVRLGHINNNDLKVLHERLLPLHSNTIPGRMKEIVEQLLMP